MDKETGVAGAKRRAWAWAPVAAIALALVVGAYHRLGNEQPQRPAVMSHACQKTGLPPRSASWRQSCPL